MNRMDGKVCVVTGAAQGLGAAIARRLAAAGAAGIVITGRNLRRGETLAKEIATQSGCGARFIRADFARVDDCRHVIAETDRMFGRVEAARAVNFLVSDDAGLMTGAIVNFDQSVWGAVAGGMPVPDGPMRLG